MLKNDAFVQQPLKVHKLQETEVGFIGKACGCSPVCTFSASRRVFTLEITSGLTWQPQTIFGSFSPAKSCLSEFSAPEGFLSFLQIWPACGDKNPQHVQIYEFILKFLIKCKSNLENDFVFFPSKMNGCLLCTYKFTWFCTPTLPGQKNNPKKKKKSHIY